MYSINVFLTFSLSNLGMSRFWITAPQGAPGLVPPPAGAPHRPRAVRDHPHRDLLREVRRRRLAHAGHHRRCSSSSASSIRRHYAPRRRRHPAARRRAPRPAARTRRQAERANAATRRARRRDRPATARGDALRGRLRRPRAARAPHAPAHVPAGTSRGSSSARSRSSTRACSRASTRCTSSRARTQHAARQVRAVRGVARACRPRARSRRASRSPSRPRRLATELIQKYPKGLFVAGQLIFEEDTFVDAHPPQRDGVPHPAAPAARGRADGRPPGAPQPEGRPAPRGAEPHRRAGNDVATSSGRAREGEPPSRKAAE